MPRFLACQLRRIANRLDRPTTVIHVTVDANALATAVADAANTSRHRRHRGF